MTSYLSEQKKVAVIGAGPSGLVTVKEMLSQGIDVRCFEAQNGIGGAFRSVEDGGRSYDSVELTVSNYFMAFSDFMPDVHERRRYWKVGEYLNYLEKYVAHFQLTNHILLAHRIIHAEIVGEQVLLTIVNGEREFTEAFDHLIICTGTHFMPSYPDYLPSVKFRGEVVHSCDYQNAEQFRGKKVLCIGIGESGADTVHEVSQVTDCQVLVRDMPNVIPRWINDFTNDSFTSYCYYEMGKMGIDRFMKFKAWFYLNFSKKLDQEELLLQRWVYERDSFTSKFFTKNDIFVKDLVDGRLQLSKGEVKEVLPRGVITDQGERIEADVILCNTGYKTCFKDFTFGEDFAHARDLFKQMIHPRHGAKVALVGWARPTQGGIPACSEMQARYLSLVIAGKKKLPPVDQLKRIIERDKKYAEYYFDTSKYIGSLVNYHDYMPDLAALVDCKPKFFRFRNPLFFLKMYFGSHVPAFYRLDDPDPEVRSQAWSIVKSLPVAYSNRRKLAVLLFTLVFRPLESLYLYRNGM